MTTFNFGDALSMLRAGRHVTRQGWNGRGMCLVLQAGYPEGTPANVNTARALGVAQGTKIVFRPYIMIKAVDGSFVPWVASQTDLLADDWYAVSAER